MSGFWVLRHLFRVQAANIDWDQEAERLGYEGPRPQFAFDFAPLQFRWLLHPSLGLPRQPFVLSRNRHPGGSVTLQQLANLPDWEDIETVGLPVDDSWIDTGYELGPQGSPDDPLEPFDAAQRRLELGAPRIGWTRLAVPLPGGSVSLPDWEPVVLDAYLMDLRESRFFRGVHAMLRDRPDPGMHAAYDGPDTDVDDIGRLDPRPFTGGANRLVGSGQPGHVIWRPLGLLLLSSGIDPLASLALGFGTAIRQHGERDDLYRVSVRHVIRAAGRDIDVDLADVVTVNDQLPAPNKPPGVSAALVGHTRPQSVDGAAVDTVAVTWRRQLNPAFANLGAGAPQAVSYAVGRVDRNSADILLARRPPDVGGYLAFAASKPAVAEPVLFADHLTRVDPFAMDHTYAVAAQDAFGRWSSWEKTPYRDEAEPPRAPSILGVTMEPAGVLTVVFGWDWSDRSPEFMELVASYEDDPANVLMAERLDFKGGAKPTLGAIDVVPLDPDLDPAADWGFAQDQEPDPPGTRFYQLRASVSIDFAGRLRRVVQVQARGQCHLHERASPGSNISALTPPFSVETHDLRPPDTPPVPESPQWASVRDRAGVSRALLRWTPVPGATGYVIYEATETTLLAALDKPGPDTREAFSVRLEVLRGADLPSRRTEFRRLLEAPPIPTSAEVALPRGSSVLHLYAITAVNANRVESAWPLTSKGFIAVAAPRIRMPRAPELRAKIDRTLADPVVTIHLELDAHSPVERVDLHRAMGDELAATVDSMGPPLLTFPNPSTSITLDDTGILTGWQRIWYRAVAWSAKDDLNGFVEARSPSSAPVSVLAPPSVAPSIIDGRVNEPGSTDAHTLVSWQTSAPFRPTAFGPHRAVIEARDMTGSSLLRLDGQLDAMARIMDIKSLPGPDAGSVIHRVLTESGDRLYAWLPRPSPNQTVGIEIKIIDPLGRIGRLTADVPPLASTMPVIDTIDPDNGRPGNTFTIFGTNLILRPGDSVDVLLDLPTTPDAPPNPGLLTIVGTPTSTEIVAVIPPMPQEDSFGIVVVRSDGAEAFSPQALSITLL